jgi:peroxiredoxin
MNKSRRILDRILKASRHKATRPIQKSAWLSFGFDFVLLLVALWCIHWWQVNDTLRANNRQEVPIFSLPTLDGQIISNADTDKISVYYFFAPWCTICHHSIENLNTLQPEINSGEINLYIIALDWKDLTEVENFVVQHNLPVKPLLGTQQQRFDFKIKAFPTYYVTNAQNTIEWVSVGYSTSLGLNARLQWLLD